MPRVNLTRAARFGVCLLAAVFVVTVVGPSWRSGFPPVYPDSHSYLAVASRNPWSPAFWADQRPPTYPLWLWLFGSSPAWVAPAQTVAWAAAWAWLLSTAWHELRNRTLAAVVVVTLGLVALQGRWAMWSTQILTESLSGTLAVAGVAAWWRWLAEPGRFRTGVVIAVTVAWMLVRDSNAVTMSAVALPIGLVALGACRRPELDGPRRRAVAGVMAAVLIAGGYSLATQAAADRNTVTFHNNMGIRWLASPDMRAWFVARGLPESAALDARVGSDAWADGEAFLRDPALADYRAWADGPGRRWAAWSAVARADWYLGRFFDELDVRAHDDYTAYDSYAVGEHLPARPLGPFDPVGSAAAIEVWGAAVVLLAAAAWVRGRRRQVWFAVLLVVPVLSDLYLSFVGDAIEVSRHLSGGLLRWSVVSIVAAAVLADALLAGDGRRAGAEPCAT